MLAQAVAGTGSAFASKRNDRNRRIAVALIATDPRAFPAKLALLVMIALSWPARRPPAN